MGNLIIKQVEYSGDLFKYKSPVLSSGINIILGDNGSGKSTFSYFIEFALGGTVKIFSRKSKSQKYIQVIGDTNNYVKLTIIVNDEEFTLKRYFIDSNSIFVENFVTKKTFVFSVKRDKNTAPYIFSDWLLEKLDIPVFKVNLGTIEWKINFTDLFRLLNYDQNTEANKIYKQPTSENFINDSLIIRRAIFEILLGISSAEYFLKIDEFRLKSREKDTSKAVLDNFKKYNSENLSDKEGIEEKVIELEKELVGIYKKRDFYLHKETNLKGNDEELSLLKLKLIKAESQTALIRNQKENIKIEYQKVSQFLNDLESENEQIEKIMFTHEKLNLFNMKVCPFCMSEQIDHNEGTCLCGSKFNDEVYEKFVYNTEEYVDILKQKRKSIVSINNALNDIESDKLMLDKKEKKYLQIIEYYTERLNEMLSQIEFYGKSSLIDEFNNNILNTELQIQYLKNTLNLSNELERLTSDFKSKVNDFEKAENELEKANTKHIKNNKSTIKEFNTIYNDLLKESSYNSNTAKIDDDYMPLIDNGEYRANSSHVPKRLMYYFTILSLSLKLNHVKHPRFLLIDTPEASGIDLGALNLNLFLIKKAIEEGNKENNPPKKYQIILTTGYGKFPDEFSEYIKEEFNTKTNNYILKESL